MNSTTLLNIEIQDSPFLAVQLLKGNEVIEILADEQFLADWDLLYQECPWATVFQSRAFASSWYQHFQGQYLPIMVKSETDGKLNGLFTLALERERNGPDFILGAGDWEADCQTWISTVATSDVFVKAALDKILEEFPGMDIKIRHLPPETPLDWTKSDALWNNRCVVEPLKRPLVQLKDFSIAKRNRKRINRLERMGSFEDLATLEELSAHIDELSLQYDFRQGAMFNKTLHRSSSAYNSLILSLFEKGLLKATIFRVKDEIIAGLVVIIGKNQAHLGAINVHSPLYAKYSPGYIQFLLVSQQLSRENVEYLDLTPGGDPYKDRIATTHDQVHNLIVSNKRQFILKRKVRKSVYDTLSRNGIRPLSVELYVEKQKYLVRKKGLLGSLLDSIKNKLGHGKQISYELNLANDIKVEPRILNRNHLDDLLSYTYESKGLTEWEFLESCMRKFENGKEVFTLSTGGKLYLMVWFHQPVNNMDSTGAFPENSIILHDLYLGPTAWQDVEGFLFEAVKLLKNQYPIEKTYLAASEAIAKKLKTNCKNISLLKTALPGVLN